jgi:aspartate/methionine/tyrosine aminotransferase
MPIPVGLAKLLIKTGIAAHIPSIRALMGDGLAYLKYYNDRILGSPNVELRAAQTRLDELPFDAIDLSVGAPQCDERVVAAITASPPPSGYPPVCGLRLLRHAIAKKLLCDNRVCVDPEHEVLVCNGVSQGIALALDTFVDRGDRVVVFDPCFFMYRLTAQNRGARLVEVATWLEAGHTVFRERDLARALRGAKLLFINSPANPTGGVLAPDTLERIAWWCKQFDVLIFSDEVYERFVYSGAHTSIAGFPIARPRTITANGFSKSHGLAAFRVGYVAGPRYLIQPMLVSKLATTPFVALASQQIALAALSQPPSDWEPTRQEYLGRRGLTAQRLARARLSYEMPAGAFYFWVPVRQVGYTGERFAATLLKDAGVIVMSGRLCGRSGRDHIRISFAGERSALEVGLDRVETFVAGRCISPPNSQPDNSIATSKPAA